MNGLDIAVLGVIALSGVFALARGFVREVLSVIAWVGAAAITLYGYDFALGIAAGYFKTKLLAQFVAGAGLFLSSLIVLTIITGLAAHRVRSSTLSPLDRTLGLIFGLARGLVLVSLAYLVIAVSIPQSDFPVWVKEAKSTPFLDRGAQMLRDLLPRSLKQKTAALAGHAQRLVGVPADALGGSTREATTTPPAAPSYSHGEQQDLKRVIQDQNNSR